MYRMFKEVLIFFENEFKNRRKSFVKKGYPLANILIISFFLYYLLNFVVCNL